MMMRTVTLWFNPHVRTGAHATTNTRPKTGLEEQRDYCCWWLWRLTAAAGGRRGAVCMKMATGAAWRAANRHAAGKMLRPVTRDKRR